MAVNNPSGLTLLTQTVGQKYTKVTDNSTDWTSVSNDTYFYDLATSLVYYKDTNGIIVSPYVARSLEQTLSLGNSAGIYNIDLNNNDLQNIDNTTTTTLNINSVVTGSSHKNLGLDNTGRVIQVGNSSNETFVYSFNNALDNLDFYNDGIVRFGWDAPGNDLEFYMDTEPAGASDLRALATFNYGTQQNTFVTTVGVLYDLYGAGVTAGSQLTVIIVIIL